MWTEPILHVDMDSFFVEVERLGDPSLRGRPVAVGGSGPRGVIASASYEARKFGVSSAQPTAIALRLCPPLMVIPASHEVYDDMSARVFSVFRSVTPVVEGLSLDEAFLDVGGLRRHYESSVQVGEILRARLRTELGLPASVGVASVKFIAKLASEVAKPNGIRHVPKQGQDGFLRALPVSAMWGVGPATEAALERLGVETVGDIAELPEASLIRALGPTSGAHLHDLAHGIDPRDVTPDIEAKSISVEETYRTDLETPELVETALLSLAQRLSSRLRRAGLRGRTISLKLRYADFTTITRSETEPVGVDTARAVFAVASRLAERRERPDPVRLLGLGASSLEPADSPRQLDMEADGGWIRVEEAVAEVRERFGDSAVGPARLVPGPQNEKPRAREKSRPSGEEP